MITGRAWAGRRYAVLGLARSGLATVAALAAAGAHVVAWDTDPAARERGAAIDGVIIHDLADLRLDGAAGLVVSPGVPLNTHPLVAAARAGTPEAVACTYRDAAGTLVLALAAREAVRTGAAVEVQAL